MDYTRPDALVSTAWLAAHLDDANVRVVDGSWHLPPLGRDARAEYAAAHIPGAAFFDIDAIADPASDLPHMLPAASAFGAAVGALGIANSDRVVVYDTNGIVSAPRVWWMFRAFGHETVAVLDGGLPQWQREEHAVTDATVVPAPAAFTATLRDGLVRDLDALRDNLASAHELVVDVRAAGRFNGTEPEFRAGVRSGHMPGAVNLPYAAVLDAAGEHMLPADALTSTLAAAGVTGTRPVVTSCGSGITACIVALAMHLVGRDEWAVYDGSWTEWGGRADTPIET